MELLTPEIGTLFWMTLSFLFVAFILKKFAWKPILNALQNREKSIAAALASARKAREEMVALQADNERILKQARMERETIMKEAKITSDRIIKASKDKANEEGQKIIMNAKQHIENEKKRAIKEIRDQVAILSVDIAEKILKQKLDNEKAQNDYINKLIKEVKIN